MASIIGAVGKIKYLKKGTKNKPLMKEYRDRNDRLSCLGITYQEYLATEEWKTIRHNILNGIPPCLLCSHPASQVHHTDYEWDTLLGVDLRALAPLCSDCHKRIEFDGNRKRSIEEANQLLVIGLNSPSSRKWLTAFRERVGCKNYRKREFHNNERKREAEQKKKRKKEARDHWNERKRKKGLNETRDPYESLHCPD